MLNLIYFSGTGHSWQVAQWVKDFFLNKKQKVDLRPLVWNKLYKSKCPENKKAIGLFYPVYGFTPPWILLAFLWSWPQGLGRPVFLVNTRGAIKIRSKVIWGVSGLALWLPYLLLRLKGYQVKGLLALDLPSNWITAHPGPSLKSAQFMMAKEGANLKKFSQKMFEKRPYYGFKLFCYLPLDLILLPLSIYYLLLFRWVLAKLFVASSKCNNCGKCLSACPVGAISRGKKSLWWNRKCLSCMRCLNFCPEKAIYPAHLPLLIALSFSLASFLLVFAFAGFILALLISLIVFVLAILCFYPLMNRLATRPHMEKLVSASTYWNFYKYWDDYKNPTAKPNIDFKSKDL